jgi:mandelate racemase
MIRIRNFRVRAVRVPLPQPHRTASGVVAESPMVLVDLVTSDGVSGHGIVFPYSPAALKPTAELIQNLAPLVEGEALAPAAIHEKLAARFRLLGTQGLVGMAIASISAQASGTLGQSRAGLLRRVQSSDSLPMRVSGIRRSRRKARSGNPARS